MKKGIIESVKNPLGVIAVFAGISEIAMTTTMLNLQGETQRMFIWFVMLFPILLVGAFFFVLYRKPACLFSPADYQDDTAYLRSIGIAKDIEGLSIKVEQLESTVGTLQKYLDKVAESAVSGQDRGAIDKEKRNLIKLNSIHEQEQNSLYKYLNTELDISHDTICSIVSQSSSVKELPRSIQTSTGDSSKASRLDRILTNFSTVSNDFNNLKTMIEMEGKQ